MVTTVLKVACVENDTNDELKKLWSLDQIGIEYSEPRTKDVAVSEFEKSIEFVDGKYSASLPWKEDYPKLPSNRSLALKRLHSLLSSLRKTPDKLKIYNNLIQEQLSLGFIERVVEESSCYDNSKLHYIPHHAVKKDSPTTPIRIVYDCSAKASKYSPSLNECLMKGPSLLNDLGSIY